MIGLGHAARIPQSAIGAIAAVLLISAVASSHAACLPVPSPELDALDHDTYRDRSGAAARANARLAAALATGDALTSAQVYALIADASDDHFDAHHAVVAGLAQLDRVPPSTPTQTIRWRLMLADADSADVPADIEAARATADRVLAEAPRNSVAHACALISRAAARSDLEQLDLAAADASAAYRLAEAARWEEPRANAEFWLAHIYLHAGLLDAAEHMIDDFVTFARDHDYRWMLAIGSDLRGQVLLKAGKYSQARAELAGTRDRAILAHDDFGAAFSNVALCEALIDLHELDAARDTCTAGVAVFVHAKRLDVLEMMKGFQARIDLERGQAAAALAKLNDALDREGGSLAAGLKPAFLRYRGQARAALGDGAGAYADLRRSVELEDAARIEQQRIAVAVLAAASQAERLVGENRLLEERNTRQRQDIAARELNERLWIGLLLCAALLISLLGWLVVTQRRAARRLRTQQTVVRTAASCAPDTLVLLDRSRRVRFANRGLFSGTPPPGTGEPLSNSLPAAVRPQVEAAIDALFERGQPVSTSLSLAGPDGELRQYEMRGTPAVDGKEFLGVTLRTIDVTEVRALERELIDVASRERNRLSSDLHEGLGQELTGVSLLLRTLTTAIERGQADAASIAAEARRHVADAIDSVRELARGLSPVQVEQGSLRQALERLARDAGRRLHLDISLQCTGDVVPIGDSEADHVYRIVYEALTNAGRHSGCRRVAINVSADGGALHLTVDDDGRGLPPGEPAHDGVGLRMMAYRARLLGGDLLVTSNAAGGTRVSLSVPVSAAACA